MFFTAPMCIILLAAFSFWAGRRRAIQCAVAQVARSGVTVPSYSNLHSLPFYHGFWVAMLSAGAALALLISWAFIVPPLEKSHVFAQLTTELSPLSAPQKEGFWRDAQALAAGNTAKATTAVDSNTLHNAAEIYKNTQKTTSALFIALLIITAGLGFFFAWKKITPDFRARHRVETFIKMFLITASGVAILTTVFRHGAFLRALSGRRNKWRSVRIKWAAVLHLGLFRSSRGHC
jgi:phosphate transport system permease protein